MPVLKLAELTWEELRDLDKTTVLAILPVGATEAHGPHLPLATDVIIAESMAMSGARKLSARGFAAIVLPPIAYTPATFAADFPGTVTAETGTLTATVVEIARSLAGHGISTMVVANAHLDPDNIAALGRAGEVCDREGILRFVFPDATRKPWALRLTEEFKSGACHAGRYEGSIVMAVRPELVRTDIQGGLPANPASLSDAIRAGHRTFEAAGGPRAYFGFPAEATAEEGTRTLDVLGSIVAEATLSAIDAS